MITRIEQGYQIHPSDKLMLTFVKIMFFPIMVHIRGSLQLMLFIIV